jgi:hypothetical protein
MTKKLTIQSNQTLYYTCDKCDIHVIYFCLITMTNVTKIDHLVIVVLFFKM